jgi:YihY family inner membrane protein
MGATASWADDPLHRVASAVTGSQQPEQSERPQRGVARYVERTIDALDGFQQRHGFTAVPCAIFRKYSDDRAGRLAGQISHAAFLAVFPMVLVLLTLVGVFLDGHTAVQDDIINSALRQFPVLGSDLRNNVHQLSTANTLALVIGLVWLLYGSMRLSRSAQVMMAVVWDIDRDELPNFWRWLPRAAGFLVVLGVGFLAGGALVGLGAFGRFGSFSAWIGLVLSLVVNVLMYWGAFVVLVRIPRKERAVWPGAVIGGVGWTVLQFAGAQLVNHQLRHLSNLYGTFATILGLIWWIALGSMITVFAAEANVVLTRRLWPRSIRRTRTPRPDPDPTGPQPPSHPKPTDPLPTTDPVPPSDPAATADTADPEPAPTVRAR